MAFSTGDPPNCPRVFSMLNITGFSSKCSASNSGMDQKRIMVLEDCSWSYTNRTQDDKGDVSAETTGPAWAAALVDIQISAERVAELWLISKSNN
ncbi:hypothetical protein V6N13_046224 [Hibiscus sabdariffa]